MSTKTYHQLDAYGCYVFSAEARAFPDDPENYNIPGDAITIAPPIASSGSVARWTGSAWEIVADHRRDTLYRIASGQTYSIGADAEGQSYNGLGPIPEWLSETPPPPAPPTLEQLQKQFTDLMQGHLDSTAQQRGYDGILSLCSYYGSQNPQFNAEAIAGLAFRDAVWVYGNQVLADVLAEQREIPTPDELMSEVPQINWPT
ncbi:MAG: hypothetical protein LBE62_12065 [Azonexus sp.]|jgi:hypothetical protein|nr:hypothetical protein [Azonexus sp.]